MEEGNLRSKAKEKEGEQEREIRRYGQQERKDLRGSTKPQEHAHKEKAHRKEIKGN